MISKLLIKEYFWSPAFIEKLRKSEGLLVVWCDHGCEYAGQKAIWEGSQPRDKYWYVESALVGLN